VTDTWAESALLRQGLYRFAGGALLPPGNDTLDVLRSAAKHLDDLGTGGFAFHRDWVALQDELQQLSGGSLGEEYVRLFASGVDMALCPPVESYYRGDARGSAAGEIGAVVTRKVRSLGLVHTSPSIPPDHIVAEMEVMSALCAREAAAWRTAADTDALARLSEEEDFLAAHLSRWVPLFRDRLREVNAEGLYRALVEFAYAFVVHDLDYVRAARAFHEVPA
jgi:TorA maturation chaperone TorD